MQFDPTQSRSSDAIPLFIKPILQPRLPQRLFAPKANLPTLTLDVERRNASLRNASLLFSICNLRLSALRADAAVFRGAGTTGPDWVVVCGECEARRGEVVVAVRFP